MHGDTKKAQQNSECACFHFVILLGQIDVPGTAVIELYYKESIGELLR